MKGSTLRATAAALVLAVPLVAGCGAGTGGNAPAGQDGQVIPAGDATDGLVLTFSSDPNPPAKGANRVTVTVKQADGSPVTDAAVATVWSMPAMPSMNMPAMRSEAALQHEAEGRYRGTSELSMGGTWNVTVTVSRGAEELGTRRLSLVANE